MSWETIRLEVTTLQPVGLFTFTFNGRSEAASVRTPNRLSQLRLNNVVALLHLDAPCKQLMEAARAGVLLFCACLQTSSSTLSSSQQRLSTRSSMNMLSLTPLKLSASASYAKVIARTCRC